MISLAEMSRHVWACAPSYVELFLEDLAALDPSEVSVPTDGDRAPPPYTVRDGVAHIEINGMIMREVPPIIHAAGIPATSTKETAATIREALAAEDVNAIMLDIDSPGGTLAGTAELADLVYSGRANKPINAHAEDLAASAAYWIGSQTDRFTASQTAQVGSLGVYRVMIDTSEAAAKAGARVHVIKSGDHKGTGATGAPITADQLKTEQSIIDRAAALFLKAVKRGRGQVDVSEVASGRTWLASQAEALGLIDGVETAREAVVGFQAAGIVAAAETQNDPPKNNNLKSKIEEASGNAREANETQKEENTMSDQKLISEEGEAMATLKAQLEEANTRAEEAEATADKATAQATAAAASLTGIKESQKTEAIEAAVKAGKVTPAMRVSVEAYAEKCGDDVAELAAFLATLPTQTKPNPIGTDDGQQIEKTNDKGLAIVASLFNRDPAQVEALANVRAVTSDGFALTQSGDRVRLSEIIEGA